MIKRFISKHRRLFPWFVIKWLRLCVVETHHKVYELLFSEESGYVYCLISKNGCSSILSSILEYDFGMTVDRTRKVWVSRANEISSMSSLFSVTFNDGEDVDISRFRSMRKFIVLRDPEDRLISYINNCWKEDEYNKYFPKDVPPERFVDRVLGSYYICADTSARYYDRHAVAQRQYYEKYRDLFGDELEVVRIEELPDYFQQLTGKCLIKNNVTQDNQKVCSSSTLTRRHGKWIRRILRDYEFNADDDYSALFRK